VVKLNQKRRISRLRTIYEGIIEDNPEAYTKQLFDDHSECSPLLGCISP